MRKVLYTKHRNKLMGENMQGIEIFVDLINKRDGLIEKHCNGETWAELCNYPEHRDWYIKNIAFLDFQIINVANAIIERYGIW